VVTDLLQEWAKQIEDAKSAPNERENLMRAFDDKFGFRLQERGGMIEVPTAKEALGRMALRLGQNCRPQYLRAAEVGAGEEIAETLVFLPVDRNLVATDASRDEWKAELGSMARATGSPVQFHVEVEPDDEGAGDLDYGRGNPFVMLATNFEAFPGATMQGGEFKGGAAIDLDKVASLHYWKSEGDAEVHEFLRWVEDPKGKSMFAEVSYSFGLGYTLPAFVRNEALRSARWRPWAAFADAQREKENRAFAAVDALLYALLASAGATHPLLQLKVTNKLDEEHGWTLPLLHFHPIKRAFEFKRQIFEETSNGWRPRSNAVKQGHEIATLKQLFEFLEKDPKVVPAITAEARHFFASLCFTEGYTDQDVRRIMSALHDWISSEFRPAMEKAPNFEDYRALVEKVEKRSDTLHQLGRAALAEEFKD
jgi:hypothetical protein